MATVTLPVTVADDDEIVTAWGNAVVQALTELLGDAVNNGVMVGDGTRSVKFVAPTGTVDLVFKFDASAGTLVWSADAGSASFSNFGRALTSLADGSDGSTYLKLTKNGTVFTVTPVTARQVAREGIPRQTTAPSNPVAGDLWIDSS